METDLIKWQPIHAMIEAYGQAQTKIKQGFSMLEEAKEYMSAFGEHNRLFDRIDNYDICNGATQKSLATIKKEAWRGIIDKTQIRNLMTEKRVAELDTQLYDNSESETLPELTGENVQAFIENLSGNMSTLLTETLVEVFDILRPSRSEYKTNTEYEIGERVILNHMIEYDKWRCTSLNYSWAEQRLRCIDNVFHLLDGKGPIKWPGDLVTTVKQAIGNYQTKDRKWSCETEYFSSKWFKKGSFHIRFKRLDLLAELNKRAGGNRLRKR